MHLVAMSARKEMRKMENFFIILASESPPQKDSAFPGELSDHHSNLVVPCNDLSSGEDSICMFAGKTLGNSSPGTESIPPAGRAGWLPEVFLEISSPPICRDRPSRMGVRLDDHSMPKAGQAWYK